MANLTPIVFGMIIMTGSIALGAYFLCGTGTGEVDSQEDTVFEFIARFVTVQTCEDTSPVLNWLIFVMAVLPWLLLIASFVFSNTATTIVGLIGAAVAGIGAFISGLF